MATWGATIEWTGFARAIAWPVAILVLGTLAILSGRAIAWIALLQARLKKVEALGVTVELTETSAVETRQSIEGSFRVLRERVRREFDHHSRTLGLASKLQLIIDGASTKLASLNNVPDVSHLNLRATIYVPDPIISTLLYQLLDYYPKAGGPRGRTISQRFGIAGRAWRSGDSQVAGHVPPDIDARIRDWGMTRAEASERGGTRESYLAIPILSTGSLTGILYLDAQPTDVFGNESDLCEKFIEITRCLSGRLMSTRLGDDLLRIQTTVGNRTPGISFDF